MSQYGIYAFADEADASVDGQIAAMRRNGLQGVELRGVDGVNISDISLSKAGEVRKKLEDSGLRAWSLGSPIGKIPLDGDHATHVEKLRRTLEIAKALDCENIRVFSYYLPKDGNPAAFSGEVIDRLGELLDYAEEAGVALCHENEKGIFGDNAVRCRQLLTSLPALRGVFDPANFIQCGQDTAEAWQLLKDRIFYLHIKDARADGTVVPAGQGQGHVKDIVEDYLRMGGCAMTVEPHLKVFAGLSALEREGDTSAIGHAYRTSGEAFDAACAALKGLLG